MWNVVRNFDVECGGELWCGMLQRTVTWNALENGDVKYGG